MLTPDTVANLSAGITQYATSSRKPLSAPEFQIISEYRPANGPRAFEFDLIHESVWRHWDGARQLPGLVGMAEFSDLLLATAAQWLPEHQRNPLFTIVGFTLMYDDPAEPATDPDPGSRPDGGVASAPTRVLVAADVDGHRYHMVTDASRPSGTVRVTEPGMPVPVTADDPLSGIGHAALRALNHLVDLTNTVLGRDAAGQPDRDDTSPLSAGEIVTVHGDRWDDEQRAQLWVVVDVFDDYTIAVLGGDGYQWPRVPRRALTKVTPAWIRRVLRPDATHAYVDADTKTPTLVDETFTDHGTSGYELVRTYRLAGSLLRVRVWRGPQPEHSSAVVQLLDPAGDHSVTAITGLTSWHAATPSEAADGVPLYAVAEELLYSAVRILTPADPARPRQP
ncbi:hypothetical protein OHA72_10545 [Dactylosporangium sp. NBC_01737]|uniref:hypothetical protein n=1 Tax=Dactylosporangium sp. NBC_01737 TaxID=2975959 RepID=UPI002E126548|nr:hypothetical protein OHA72_10545 [Dactylosporangium sp. NBC_01737]